MMFNLEYSNVHGRILSVNMATLGKRALQRPNTYHQIEENNEREYVGSFYSIVASFICLTWSLLLNICAIVCAALLTVVNRHYQYAR